MTAAIKDRMTEVLSCGEAITGLYELSSEAMTPITNELTSRMPIPAGRYLATSPLKISAASEIPKVTISVPEMAPAKTFDRTRAMGVSLPCEVEGPPALPATPSPWLAAEGAASALRVHSGDGFGCACIP